MTQLSRLYPNSEGYEISYSVGIDLAVIYY